MCFKKNWNFFIFILAFCSQIGVAQVNTYGFSEAISSYVPLSTSTVAYTAPWDDHVAGSAVQAPIGFNFVYDGVSHNQCFISPNGFLTFASQPTSANYFPLSTATPYTGGGSISALGVDLIGTSTIVYNTIGFAPNRTFVVQWSNAVRKSTTGNFNFQIRLNETTNTVQFSYGSCTPTGASAINVQVGLRGVTNDFLQADVKNRLQTGPNVNFSWASRTIEGNSNSSTARTSVTEFPNNGLLYTFTPPLACTTPAASPSGLLIGGTNVTATSFVGNSFTAAFPAPTNYLILRSTVNTPPTAIQIPNRTYWNNGNVIAGTYTVVSNTAATTFIQTGLAPNTTYFYWVIPYNTGCLGGPFYRLTGILTASNTTCVAAPTGLNTSALAGNSFTVNWNAVAGATDYRVDVSTTNTFTAILPSYNNIATGGLTSINVSGLNAVTNYFIRVRAVGSGCFFYSATLSVTTLCGSFSIPYFQNFDTTAVNAVPQCSMITNDNGDASFWQVKNTLSSSAPNSIHLNTNTATDSDDWFFTPGLQLTAGVTYRLRFKYNTESAGLFSENLRIRLGSGPSVTTMDLTILNLPGIINTVYQTATVDFTAFITDVYYVGFEAYSFSGQSKIIVDDISVIVSPTCFEPTDITITSVGANTATITWVESVPPATNGYQYYVSTSSVIPNPTQTPTGAVGPGVTTASLSGLNSATLYYVWVRGNCSPTDQSIWSLTESFSTNCALPTTIPVISGSLCGGGSTVLQATPNPGGSIEWYSDAAGTNLIATGNSFTTPNLASTTTYYAQSKSSGGLITMGPSSPIAQGGALASENELLFFNFNVTTLTDLLSIDVFPLAAGQTGAITVKNAISTIIGSYSFTTTVSGGATPQTIPLGVNLIPGSYVLSFDVVPASGFIINADNASYPYSSAVASLNGNSFDNTFYMYAYNWKFSNICRSLLTPVVASITPAPAISLSETTTTICSGDTTSVISLTGFGSYDTLTWTPATFISGDEFSGYTFNPTTTTNYTLTAAQTSGSMCMRVLNLLVTVNPEPPAISIVPANVTRCEGQVQILNAALSSGTPAIIFQENFNAPTNGWLNYNTSTGGLIDESIWTLRNSVYNYSSVYWNIAVSSNDASQFYMTNSDAQGGPASNRTMTFLETPVLNFTGFTSASINFWHFLRYSGGNRARVEASIDGGASWTTMASFTSSRGSASNFANSTVNLNTLIGNPAVRIRFYFDATWGFGWAIDNVTISGNLAIEVAWTPATDLFFDLAATTPYIPGTPAASVYAKPLATATYIGTALGSNGCFTNSSSTITVIEEPTLGVISGNQTVCANWQPLDVVLTGYTNSIVNWQYANDAAFTSGVTPIANNTNTLTGAAMGSFGGNRFFRAVLQNGTCPTVPTNSVLINRPFTVWDGSTWTNGFPTLAVKAIFTGNFTSAGTMQACSVEVFSGNVVFNPGHNLIVDNDVRVLGGTLTFSNSASLVQRNTLDNTNTQFSNSGNIVYQRTTTPIKKFDYTYWSAPVFPQTIGAFSPNSNLFYEFNSATLNWSFTPPSSVMQRGKGYIIRTPDILPFNTITANLFSGSFIGVPNTGTITTSITGGAGQFNLIGNPYPSALSADLFLSNAANVPVVDATIYFWTHNTPITGNQYSSNDYALYNFSGGVGTGTVALNPNPNNAVPNGRIAAGQSFFIKGLSNGNVQFTNSMRLASNNTQFFRTTNEITSVEPITELERHRFWIDVYNDNGAFKQFLVAYVENATNGIDRGFDGEMLDTARDITMYVLQDDKKLTIQGRPLPFDVSEHIPVGYKSTIASSYTISLSDFDGLFTTQNIFLEDKELNVIHDLKASPYVFTTSIGTFDTRFELRYTTETLGVDNPSFNESSVIIYKNEGNDFVIKTGATLMDDIKLFDIRGRLLLQQKSINASQTTIDGGLANGVLLIQITTVDGVVVTKKVIR
jgi:hypothetical protein